MRLPSQPVTLTPEQIEELNRKLATMRHDINNQLSLIMAALELIHYKPETGERMITCGLPSTFKPASGKP